MKMHKKILKLNETELRKIIEENIDKTLGFKSVWVVYVRDRASRWYNTTRPFQYARGFFKNEVLYYMKEHKAFNKLTMEELVKHYKRGDVEMWIADFGKFFPSGEYIIMLDRLHVKKAIELGVLPPLDILPPEQRLGGGSDFVRWDITDDESINENTNITIKENIQTKSQSIKLNESQLRQIIREALNEYRPYPKDGDVDYVGPDPEKDYDIGGFTPFSKRGKKVKATSIDNNGKRIVHQFGVTDFSHGKGNLCAKVADTVKKMFYQNDKIKWTYAEESYIDEIYGMILKLAHLTKQEGNRTRGYNGPE